MKKYIKAMSKISLLAFTAYFSSLFQIADAQNFGLLSEDPNGDIAITDSGDGTASATYDFNGEIASATFEHPQNNKHISIGLSPDFSETPNPVIAAKWEANADRFSDADTAAGSQFIPPGRYGADKQIALCAVVENHAYADAVYAEIYYPENIALGNSYIPSNGQSGLGCGKMMMQQRLFRLDKDSGMNIFCSMIKDQNNNLPVFAAGYDYDDFCRLDGSLTIESSAVYCGSRNISFGDPAGDYMVKTISGQGGGISSVIEDHFTYFPVTAFETDFNAIDYGKVKINLKKTITGDEDFDTAKLNAPTVRNVGNTRLTVKILEDDMGLGRSYEEWNVRFEARSGKDSVFTVFSPNIVTPINDPLDLFEATGIDFSVNIFKFPVLLPERIGGSMVLSAEAIAHLTCE